MEQIYNERKKDIEIKRKNRTEDLFIELKLIKVAPKLTDDELKTIISKEVEINPIEVEFDELKGKCIRKAIIKNDKIGIKATRKSSIYPHDKGSLLEIYNNANCKKVHTYELLKQNGYIKNPIEELIC